MGRYVDLGSVLAAVAARLAVRGRWRPPRRGTTLAVAVGMLVLGLGTAGLGVVAGPSSLLWAQQAPASDQPPPEGAIPEQPPQAAGPSAPQPESSDQPAENRQQPAGQIEPPAEGTTSPQQPEKATQQPGGATQQPEKAAPQPGGAEPAPGQAEEAAGGLRHSPWMVLLVAMLVVVLSVGLGSGLSRRLRMPDYFGRISLVLFCASAGVAITVMGWPPKRGIDLSGGVILVYELEGSADTAAEEPPGGGNGHGRTEPAGQVDVDMDKLIAAVSRRVNPGGVKEVTIRQRGAKDIEIIVPEVDQSEVDRLKKKVSSVGTLEFRILANDRDHKALIEEARQSDAKASYVRDADGNIELDRNGKRKLRWAWVPVARGQEDSFAYPEIATRKVEHNGTESVEILVTGDPFNVDGGYLTRAKTGIDQSARPCVNFRFNSRGGQLFGGLTSNNLPDEVQEFSRKLGIILDGYLYSAPAIRSTIRENGQITGDFTRDEVQDLVDVLNAGSLPTALSTEPISEMITGPTLGQDTIRKGSAAIVISMALVLVFMLFYYRFSGIVACMALLMNLVMLLAIMISISAAFTLPGIAGLVLTVGMAVDANVLIFERIREELDRQATLRMAIRNGFSRASTAIVDANLTTLITATVLYVIGTDQVRGFAVTLWLGVVLSMFTAIYCSRVVFDIAEKQKWITKLSMVRILGGTSVDFLGKRRLAIGASLALIVLGMVGVVCRGKGILDIDFTGGASIEIVFTKPHDVADIRDTLSGLPDLAVSNVQLASDVPNVRFMINTSSPPDIDGDAYLREVKDRIAKAFGDELAHYTAEVVKTAPIVAPQQGAAPPDGEGSQPGAGQQTRGDLPAETLLASADPSAVWLAQADAPREEAPAAGDRFVGGTWAKLHFEHAVNHDTLVEMFDEAFSSREFPTVEFELSNPKYTAGDDTAFNTWEVQIKLPEAKAKALFAAIQARLESTPVFPSSSSIGHKVSATMQVDAIVALLASLVFIVGYIWVRFQRVMFGLAAVVALVHDVLITLGMIALSAYVANYLGFLLLSEFKIGLPVLAAFLTIIGYSLNDTIVVFDRVREVKGKAPRLTQEMVNKSINQTLSRTLLTSLTTLMVVVILYIGGGQGIHAFAFSLVVGVVVGTYSSIFVAAPVLVWMSLPPAKKPS